MPFVVSIVCGMLAEVPVPRTRTHEHPRQVNSLISADIELVATLAVTVTCSVAVDGAARHDQSSRSRPLKFTSSSLFQLQLFVSDTVEIVPPINHAFNKIKLPTLCGA
jgi:hypothetical protein